jgi:hypothetical protein
MKLFVKISWELLIADVLLNLFCSFIFGADAGPEAFNKFFTLQKKGLIDESAYQIKNIKDMEINRFSEIYILDQAQNIVRFDRDGKNLITIAKPGNGPGELGLVSSFDIDSKNNIVFLDVNKFALQVLNKEGMFIKQYRLTNYPDEIYLGNNDEMYIGFRTEKGGCKLARFFGEGKPYKCFMKESGKGKIRQGLFFESLIAAVDEKGNLYAADSMEYKIYVYDSSGKKINEFGRPDKNFELYSPPPSMNAGNARLKTWAETRCILLNMFIINRRFIGVVWRKGMMGIPKNIFMDIYTLDGRKVAMTGLPDDLPPMAADDRGGLYFIKNDISKDGVDVKTWYYRYVLAAGSPIR